MCKKTGVVNFGLVATIFSVATAAKLPFNWQPCIAGPTHLNCTARAVETAMRDLSKGFTPFGIPSIDPLFIPALDIDQGTGPVSINLRFRNMTLKGLKDARVLDFQSDHDNHVFTGKVVIKKMKLYGDYSMNGNILLFPIVGDGKSTNNLEDVTSLFTLKGEKYKNSGVDYMKVTYFNISLTAKKLEMSFTNLFGGDKVLGETMNRFMNENSQEIFGELKPEIQHVLGLRFADISNRIFNRVPYDDIFIGY